MKHILIILIGTKANLANREVSEDAINYLIANNEDLMYIEHSSQLSVEENLEEIFKK